jgi:hypothetical protein
VVQAPRGVLVHSYLVSQGTMERMRLLVATQFNNAYINLALRDLAKHHVNGDVLSDVSEQTVARCVRVFDPCLTCATHRPASLPRINQDSWEREQQMSDTIRKLGLDRPGTYEIKVPGRLEEGWSEWFEGMTITVEAGAGCPTITTLTGIVTDEAALQGLLDRVYSLGLRLLSVKRVEPRTE